jgi:serine/threonine-protein kinase RsbW
VKKKIFSIPAKIDNLSKVRDFIQKVTNQNHISSKVTNSVKLAVEEVCTNIIRHGYKNKKAGSIQIELIIRKTNLTVIIIDQGQTFDPRQVKDPDLFKYVEIGKVGGLGIMMVRKLMDEIDYKVTPRGNEFRLKKYRQMEKLTRFSTLRMIINIAKQFCYSKSAIFFCIFVK